jgi:hypothetical protein
MARTLKPGAVDGVGARSPRLRWLVTSVLLSVSLGYGLGFLSSRALTPSRSPAIDPIRHLEGKLDALGEDLNAVRLSEIDTTRSITAALQNARICHDQSQTAPPGGAPSAPVARTAGTPVSPESGDSQASVAHAQTPNPDAEAAFQHIHDLLDEASGAHEWSQAQAADFRLALSKLAQPQQLEALHRLTQLVNSGTVRVATRNAPF